MSHLPVALKVPDHLVGLIFTKAKTLLKEAACSDEARANIDAVELNTEAYGRSLGKLLGKLLSDFNTQQAGGFDVATVKSRAVIDSILTEYAAGFDGLLLGVECSAASILTSVAPLSHRDECVVYNANATISLPIDYTTVSSNKQTMKLHAVTCASHPKIWLGHTSSGTSEHDKFPINRRLFQAWIAGASVDGRAFDASQDIFFGDVNFDLTDNIHDGSSTIAMLQAWSSELGVQFIFPLVRVFKERFSDRPFANNQAHKGLIQEAESMVAVAPESAMVTALDSDGLVVIRRGQIALHQHGEIQPLSSSDGIPWGPSMLSFSDTILLDHKPIAVAIDGRAYAFHNFMDFKTGKGIRGEMWYVQEKLDAVEAEFVTWLAEMLSSEGIC